MMKKSVKILDCTLRDGGYVNDWNFGFDNIQQIIKNLDASGVDFIECGFLQGGGKCKLGLPDRKSDRGKYREGLLDRKSDNGLNDYDKSLFSSIEHLNAVIPDGVDRSKIVAMIDFGEFDVENLPSIKNSNSQCCHPEFISGSQLTEILTLRFARRQGHKAHYVTPVPFVKPVQNDKLYLSLRVIFKKNNQDEALEFCRELVEKGYKIFINPTFINQYNKEEFLALIEKVNSINPYVFSIVDSMGVMRNADAVEYFELADRNLNPEITLGFHSHNNLQLSFSNAQKLIEMDTNRDVIIDSGIFGMGRGAGNIKTEFLIQYLNENYGADYKILPVLSTIQSVINKIFEEKPWGYSVPYYLAAQSFCHPNYASFLMEKNLPFEDIDKILKQIPSENKVFFDKNLIENLYNEFCGAVLC